MAEDTIISALIGLVGACGNNPKTEHTDRTVLEALAYPAHCPAGCTAEDVIEKIRAEKFAVAPDCAVCKSPCGNTSDYDMDRIYNADADIRDAKLALLASLHELAADMCKSGAALTESDAEFFYKALSRISYSTKKERLTELADEAREIKNKMTTGEI